MEINRAAREMEAHLIIIATRGSTAPQAYTLGSTTAHLVRSAPCLVLVVREDEGASLALAPSNSATV